MGIVAAVAGLTDVLIDVLIGIGAFVAMEPFTAATHRFVMHGFGTRLHRSHHRQRVARWETNDWYPVGFAAAVIIVFAIGLNLPRFGVVIPIAIGVTVYGAAYAFVHDVYIHRRVPWFGSRNIALLDRLAEAHRIHHLYNAAPFGMLCPVVPAHLRFRSTSTTRNPLARV